MPGLHEQETDFKLSELTIEQRGVAWAEAARERMLARQEPVWRL